jgi:hypothetical protein
MPGLAKSSTQPTKAEINSSMTGFDKPRRRCNLRSVRRDRAIMRQIDGTHDAGGELFRWATRKNSD